MLHKGLNKMFGKLSVMRKFSTTTFRTSKYLPFSAEQFQKTVIDVEKYVEFVPACTESKITTRISENEFYARLKVGYQVYEDSYISHVVQENTNGRYRIISVSKDNNIFKYLRSEWTIYPMSNTKCKIDYSLDYNFNNFLYQQAVGMFMGTLSQKTLNAFENRTRSLLMSAQKPIKKEATPITAANPQIAQANQEIQPAPSIMASILKPRKLINSLPSLILNEVILSRLTQLKSEGKLSDLAFHMLSEKILRDQTAGYQIRYLFNLEKERVLDEASFLNHLKSFVEREKSYAI
jgi:Oligoketide cyclase/lipid transport protein